MKRYTIMAIVLTAAVFVVGLICVLTAPGTQVVTDPEAIERFIKLSSFMNNTMIPAVCLILCALLIIGKLGLGGCALFTLINLFLYGLYGAVYSKAGLSLPTGILYAQLQILKVCPLWFAAILVYGILEKRHPVWSLSAIGLAAMVFIQTIAGMPLFPSGTVNIILNSVTACAPVLIAILGLQESHSILKRQRKQASKGQVV